MNASLFNVAIYDLEGNYITSVFGLTECAKLTGANKTSISECVNDKAIQANGFQFRKYTNSPIKTIGDVLGVFGGLELQPVAKYFEGRLICVYRSCAEADDKNGSKRGSVYNSCLKAHKSGIFHYRFIPLEINQ